MLYYVASAFLGGLLSWLLFGKNDKIKQLEQDSQREKAATANLISDHNNFKMDTNAKLNMREAEISLLKKKLDNASSGVSANELAKWKLKVKSLENQLSKNPKSDKLKKLEFELTSSIDVIKDKNATIKKLKNDLSKSLEKDVKIPADKKLVGAKSLKKLKKKLKKYKKLANAPLQESTLEVESLDMDKLIQMLKSGSLTKKHKKTIRKSK